MLSSLLSAIGRFFNDPIPSLSSRNDTKIPETVQKLKQDVDGIERDESKSEPLTTNAIENGVLHNADYTHSLSESKNEDFGDGCTRELVKDMHRKNIVENTGYGIQYFENGRSGTCDIDNAEITTNKGNRTRAHTADETQLESRHLNIVYNGLTGQTSIQKREHNPTFHSERLEKCVSLPNLFRTTSIQDKSMKISRRRKKYGSQWKRGRSESSSESENEINKPDTVIKSDTDEKILKCKQRNNMKSEDSTDGKRNWKTGISKSLDSLIDGYTSDSDEYYSCNEETNDDLENVKGIHRALNRISSIQKRSWTIRQKRRENLSKRRSMDISTFNQTQC